MMMMTPKAVQGHAPSAPSDGSVSDGWLNGFLVRMLSFSSRLENWFLRRRRQQSTSDVNFNKKSSCCCESGTLRL